MSTKPVTQAGRAILRALAEEGTMSQKQWLATGTEAARSKLVRDGHVKRDPVKLTAWLADAGCDAMGWPRGR